jgi:predicted RNA methylase
MGVGLRRFNTGKVILYRHGVKSYEVVRRLLGHIYVNTGRRLNVLDLTYGTGRFYRLSKSLINRIIAIDITRYEWEVEPTTFYQMDCRVFVDRVLRGEIQVGDVDVVVVDPMRGASSQSIIQAAVRLAGVLEKPLLYRYKEPLPCSLILAVVEVKMMYNKGYIYYGVCEGV